MAALGVACRFRMTTRFAGAEAFGLGHFPVCRISEFSGPDLNPNGVPPAPSNLARSGEQAKMLPILAATFVAYKGRKRLTLETREFESPYCVKIETGSGHSATIQIAVLTPKQLEVFLQTEFKRLAQEAGVKGARIHVERAVAADYDQVLREVSACLQSATKRAA